MNVQRRSNLEKEITIINNITIKAQEAYLIVKYLQENEIDQDVMYEKQMNTFFYYSRVIYWQMTIIELAKLLKEKEKFSLFRIIQKLKKDGEYSELKVPVSQIIKWEKILEEQEQSINNLKLQRDKIYVHEDGSDNISNLIPLTTITLFLDLAKEIILFLGKLLNLTHRMFDVINSPAVSLKYSISSIVVEKKNSMEKYRGLAKEYKLENELPPQS
ncbi:hypothetical protein [Flavobacterium sp. PL02]|uniref:hypothetical protein n=1 Tax=Flavobacterium sp. PL02 TaxID=3088354 RepID=UPI002B22B1B7|nr:hypothetical protein [Flavobacterium sp. PL02]MEA9414316.1 hypothetical protein [Flavobacterium sp. PL02]